MITKFKHVGAFFGWLALLAVLWGSDDGGLVGGTDHEAYFEEHMRMFNQYLVDMRGDNTWRDLDSNGKVFAGCFYRSFPLQEMHRQGFTASEGSWAPGHRAKKAFRKNRFTEHRHFRAIEDFFDHALEKRSSNRRRRSTGDEKKETSSERKARKKHEYNLAYKDGLLSAMMAKSESAPLDLYVPALDWRGERTVWLPALNSAQFTLGDGISAVGSGFQQYGQIDRRAEVPSYAGGKQFVYFRSQEQHCTPANLANAAEWRVIQEVADGYKRDGYAQTSADRLSQLAAEVSARSNGSVSIQDRTLMVRLSAEYLKTLYRNRYGEIGRRIFA